MDEIRGRIIAKTPDNPCAIKKALRGLSFDNLLIRHQLVTRENIELIVKDFVNFFGADSLGLFSLDIDSNDLYVLQKR
jgi:hypothetical protein